MFADDDDQLTRWRRRMMLGPLLWPTFQEWVNQAESDFAELNNALFNSWRSERLLETTKGDGDEIIHYFMPMVYGYSVVIGPDGKPTTREFGNLQYNRGSPWPSPRETREPLVDVVDGDGGLKVVAELPGVKKEEIELRLEDDNRILTISAKGQGRVYNKRLRLPASVDLNEIRSTFSDGILEVAFRKENCRRNAGIRIKVD